MRLMKHGPLVFTAVAIMLSALVVFRPEPRPAGSATRISASEVARTGDGRDQTGPPSDDDRIDPLAHRRSQVPRQPHRMPSLGYLDMATQYWWFCSTRHWIAGTKSEVIRLIESGTLTELEVAHYRTWLNNVDEMRRRDDWALRACYR